ncbi:hypothetical protein J437_LFUL014343 [Ladona fulva]|uniref:Xylose isomerase n=1 Tax=Ladona fulva TaxID=123851 RepID=A0A8K0K351_LADFU|nr:hypothetical protein J437_LFUL014343 [Ladona fulva]
MSMYGSGQASKRQKRETRNFDTNEFFPGLSRVEYRPEAGPDETLFYRYYGGATERVHGRTMEEWLRPAVSFPHAFRSTGADAFGQQTFQRPWDDGTNTMDNFKRRIRAAFEFYTKLVVSHHSYFNNLGHVGAKYWTLYDRDLCPEGETPEETGRNMDEAIELVTELQQRTGVRPLWLGVDLFSHPRYVHGAGTSPEAGVVAMAGAQVRRGMEAAHRLGAEAFLFPAAREGFPSILHSDIQREMRNYARFLRMAAEFKEKLGFRGQLLLAPTVPEGPACGSGGWAKGGTGFGGGAGGHSYLYDAMSALCFLKHHQLDRHFKLSVHLGNDVHISSAFGVLGSLDTYSPTEDGIYHDPSVIDLREATLAMKTILEQNGLPSGGGLNVVAAPHRQSIELRDLFVAHISRIDAFARALKAASRMLTDGQRYLSFHTGFGSRMAGGAGSPTAVGASGIVATSPGGTTTEATPGLEECEEYVRKHGEPTQTSARHEHWEATLAHYL